METEKIKKTENIAQKFVLKNDNGMEVVLSNLGASIINIFVKDKNEDFRDVVLGHLSLKQYKNNAGNLGCVVGRNANRIADAIVIINDKEYKLETNDGKNNLHTGKAGLQTKLFSSKVEKDNISFFTEVEDLEDNFPGNLKVEVKYTLLNDNTLQIDYTAVSDKDTVVNLTNHSYFNLNGQDESNVYDHKLKIDANFYAPNSNASIPTGEILKVDNSPFDFLKEVKLDKALHSQTEQIKTFNGIDHNFFLNKEDFRKVANLYSEESKINLEIYTDRNAMHVYTANHFPDSDTINKNNLTYPLHGGIAFETQSVPNALNMPWLKSPILKKEEIYKTTTAFKFSVK